MQRANRILTAFVYRLHGDEENPIGYSNYMIDQIGVRQAQIKAGGKSLDLIVAGPNTIESPWGEIELNDNHLTNELYGELCSKIASELKD